MSVAAVFASHTPLKDYYPPEQSVAEEVDACLHGVKRWIADYAPDLVIALGPDHYNGFFYRLMPSFCVGTAANSVGDWNTPAGALPVNSESAEACVRALHRSGVDVAISYQMDVDHGTTQLLAQTMDWATMPPLLPVFINCAAPPLPTMTRVIALGRALGEFARSYPGRVLFAASGGLSHDPPIPTLAEATGPVRERLIEGGTLSPEARSARQDRVINDAHGQIDGSSDRVRPDPVWDQAFLDSLLALDFASIAHMEDDDISRQAGCGGHEVRTWVAVAAAVAEAGIAEFNLRYYRCIPEWITGYGIVTAGPSR